MSENKGIRKSLLTPCRTVGLKRKSSVGSPAFRATDNDKKSPANPSKSCGEGELNIAQTSSANSLTEQETTKKLKFNEEVSEGRIIAVPPEATSSNEVIIPDTQNNQSMTTELTAADLDSQIEEIERSLRSKKDAIETLESDLVNMKQVTNFSSKNLLLFFNSLKYPTATFRMSTNQVTISS